MLRHCFYLHLCKQLTIDDFNTITAKVPLVSEAAAPFCFMG